MTQTFMTISRHVPSRMLQRIWSVYQERTLRLVLRAPGAPNSTECRQRVQSASLGHRGALKVPVRALGAEGRGQALAV